MRTVSSLPLVGRVIECGGGPNTLENTVSGVSRHDSTEDSKLGYSRQTGDKGDGISRGNENVAEGEGPSATKRLFAAPAPVAQV